MVKCQPKAKNAKTKGLIEMMGDSTFSIDIIVNKSVTFRLEEGSRTERTLKGSGE